MNSMAPIAPGDLWTKETIMWSWTEGMQAPAESPRHSRNIFGVEIT